MIKSVKTIRGGTTQDPLKGSACKKPDLLLKNSVTHPNIVLAVILISYMMIVIDNSVVITGLPKIHQQFGFTQAGLSWVSSAYALTFGGGLLLSARAGDIIGRRKMFISGLLLFSFSSLAIGMAPSAEWLITARAVQGVGASVLAPSTLALLQTTFTAGHARARAISLYAAAGGLSASVGLVIGGIVADLISWRVGFLINVPIGLVLILAAKKYIPETELHSGAFDFIGALLCCAGMTGLVFAIVNSATQGWSSPVTEGALITGVLLLILFIKVEKHASQPIMPLRLFLSLERSGAWLARLLYIGTAMGFFFFSTQFMQGVMHYSASQAGFAFLPAMIINFVVALNANRLIGRVGSRNLLLISLLASLAGMVMLSLLTQQSTFSGGLILPLLMIGFGLGGAMAPLTSRGIKGVDARDAGAASGIVNAAHQIGGALGLSILVACTEFAKGNLTGNELLVRQNHIAFLAGGVLIILAIVVVLFSFRKKD
ncbi:MFS transporter [Rahnella sp. SAP-1]|uniref:MFS transporter n=2 Tax=Rouxiella aceris TaxID=2703884 RepID=A0A848MPT7_9GAMM|nr:MFS transporter [Rouxiella aceris]